MEKGIKTDQKKENTQVNGRSILPRIGIKDDQRKSNTQ